MTKTISVCFYGPFSFNEIRTNSLPKEVMMRGIYLHCIKEQDQYYIYYIGKSVQMDIRHRQHLKSYEKCACSLFEIKYDLNNAIRGLEMIYIPNYDNPASSRTWNDYKVHNINDTHIFFGNIENAGDIELKHIEGAFQIHFWKKPETRKFLLTNIECYKLKDYKIAIKFNNPNIKVYGLEKLEIITPQK